MPGARTMISGPRRSRATLLGILIGLVGLALVPAGTAAGHASLVDVEPSDGAVLTAAPSEVVLTFNEAVGLTGLRVIGPDGATVSGPARVSGPRVLAPLDGGLTTGTHVVSWEVVSADGHRITGGSVFHVGERSTDTTGVPEATTAGGAGPLLAGLHAAIVGGLFVAIGLAAFAGQGEPPTAGRSRRVALAGGWVAITATLMAIPVRAADRAGAWSGAIDPSAIASLLDDGGVITVGGLIVAGFSAVLGWRRQRGAPPAFVIAAVAGIGGLVSDGHTRTSDLTWIAMIADGVHIVAAGVWTSGILALAIAARRSAGPPLHRLAVRVSGAALLAVGAVTTAGVALAMTIPEDPIDALSTRWGTLLLAKVGMVVILLVLGAVHRLWIIPAWSRAEPGAPVGRRARRVLAVEVTLLVFVLLTTGLLTRTAHSSPDVAPSAAASARIVADLSSGVGQAEVTITPLTTGVNDIVVTLSSTDGDPLTTVEPIGVSIEEPGLGIGPIRAAIHDLGAGRTHAMVDIPVAGKWSITVEARTGTFVTGQARATVTVP